MNPASEAGKAVEKAKKLKARRDANVASFAARQDIKLKEQLAEVEAQLSEEALGIYRGLNV